MTHIGRFERAASRVRPLGLLVAGVLCVSLLAGCRGDGEGGGEDRGGGRVPDGCTPACGERECGDDGCGGLCGACPSGQCTPVGVCYVPGDCSRSCAAFGLECGEHCGEPCGTCPDGKTCADGRCVCEPACDSGVACGGPDGCGGTCPCAQDASCETCALRLSLVDREERLGRTAALLVAVDFAAPDELARPVMADLRVEASGPVRLSRVGLGPPLVAGDKSLAVDPTSGRPWTPTGAGGARVLVLSSRNLTPLGAGRWLVLRYEVADDAPPGAQASFRLVRHPGLFAPVETMSLLPAPESDGAADGLGQAVVVALDGAAAEGER